MACWTALSRARASLTDIEQATARLVAEGLSNQRIADQLFISTHTVAFHLRQVFCKLDTRSRVDLARIALEHAGPAAQNPMTTGIQNLLEPLARAQAAYHDRTARLAPASADRLARRVEHWPDDRGLRPPGRPTRAERSARLTDLRSRP